MGCGWGGRWCGVVYIYMPMVHIEQRENIVKTGGELCLHYECGFRKLNKKQSIRLNNVKAPGGALGGCGGGSGRRQIRSGPFLRFEFSLNPLAPTKWRSGPTGISTLGGWGGWALILGTPVGGCRAVGAEPGGATTADTAANRIHPAPSTRRHHQAAIIFRTLIAGYGVPFFVTCPFSAAVP